MTAADQVNEVPLCHTLHNGWSGRLLCSIGCLDSDMLSCWHPTAHNLRLNVVADEVVCLSEQSAYHARVNSVLPPNAPGASILLIQGRNPQLVMCAALRNGYENWNVVLQPSKQTKIVVNTLVVNVLRTWLSISQAS